MNPDGFFLRRRGNANNIDLNRDFPDQVFDLLNWFSLCQLNNLIKIVIQNSGTSNSWAPSF